MRKKTYTTKNENGTFISFLDYDYEDEFASFLTFLCGKLGIPVPEIAETPYGCTAAFDYKNARLVAGFVDGEGCYLCIPRGSTLTAEPIIRKCYGLFT